MNLLKVLHDLPKNSIYALINDRDKEIFLTYSYDVLSSLTRVINEIKNGIGLNINIGQFDFKLLETIEHRDELKFRFNYWYDRYNVKGYKFHNKRRPVRYKLISTIEGSFKSHMHKLIYVKLKNWNREIILGVFDNIDECTDFMDSYGDLYKIKKADNKLTKEFYANR